MSESCSSGDLRGKLNESIVKAANDAQAAQAQRQAEQARETANQARRQALQVPIANILRAQISEFVGVMREQGGKPRVQLTHQVETRAQEPKRGLLGIMGTQGQVAQAATEHVYVWLLSCQTRTMYIPASSGLYGNEAGVAAQYRGLAVDIHDKLHIFGDANKSVCGSVPENESTQQWGSWRPVSQRKYTPDGYMPHVYTAMRKLEPIYSTARPLIWSGIASEADIPKLLVPLDSTKPDTDTANLANQPLVRDFMELLEQTALSALRLR
jgi:hypothetical protein